MICNSCGSENKSENKFCIECGEELKQIKYNTNFICDKCDTENETENRYCIGCGTKINDIKSAPRVQSSHADKADSKKATTKYKSGNHSHTKNKSTSDKKLFIKPAYIIVGIILTGLLFLTINRNSSSENSESKAVEEQKSTDPVMEASVFEIASKFVCSCGTCNEESLEVCKCGRAIEERQFIRDYVERNQKKEEIVFALASKYGFLKSQFAGEFKQVDKSKIFETNQITIPAINLENKKSDFDKTASISERVTIYSAFMCNCGKCGIDELKDCNCSHPKGAQEVKKFIDEKISANKYTVQEVIELVNSKYGGKKI